MKGGDADAVAAAAARLETATAVDGGTARAQRAAIRAYNKRVQRARALVAAVERETLRLSRELA